jgi:hypothetical protein
MTPLRPSASFSFSTFIGQNPIFYTCVEEGCSAPLSIACEKQT